MKNKPEPESCEPMDCPYYLVSRVNLSITSALKKSFKAAGLGHVKPSYLGVLWCLWIQDGTKTNELGRCAGLEPSSMTGMLDRMERDGLVIREADPKDRRAQNVLLTQEGQRVKETAVRLMNETLELLFAGFSEKEIETTKGFLRRVLINVHEEPTT